MLARSDAASDGLRERSGPGLGPRSREGSRRERRPGRTPRARSGRLARRTGVPRRPQEHAGPPETPGPQKISSDNLRHPPEVSAESEDLPDPTCGKLSAAEGTGCSVPRDVSCGFLPVRPMGSITSFGSMVIFLAFAVGLVAGGVGPPLWARGEIRAYRARLTAADEKLALVEKTQGQWDDQLRALTGNALAQSSTTRLSCTSPQRPRTCGARSAVTRLPVSFWRLRCPSATSLRCSSIPAIAVEPLLEGLRLRIEAGENPHRRSRPWRAPAATSSSAPGRCP